jgi:EAL domain-containing protein (putative c-di-GMP-specific phosphodiesterase class I)
MYDRVAGKLRVESELRVAITEERLRAFFQPVVDLGSGRISGMEALARWPADAAAIPPSEFIPVAEETGLIAPLGRHMMRAGCAQLASWRRRGLLPDDATMSVNVSPRQFGETDLVRDVTDALRRSGLPGSALRLEITESASLEAPERMRQTLAELRQMNVRIALDDFGTGYSSLTFLHDFPGETVKIDRSFISLMHERVDHEETVRAIIALAHNLNLEVVAEGVDAAAQLRMLHAMGCEYAQGFLFARPEDAEGAEKTIAGWDPAKASVTGDQAGPAEHDAYTRWALRR